MESQKLDLAKHLNKDLLLKKTNGSSEKCTSSVHPYDSILRGIDYDEIITTVMSNIPKDQVSDKTVIETYKELLGMRVDEAGKELMMNMKYVINSVIEGKG